MSTQKHDVSIGKAWEYFARHPEQLAAHRDESVLALDPDRGVVVGAASMVELQEKIAQATSAAFVDTELLILAIAHHPVPHGFVTVAYAEGLSGCRPGSTPSGVMPPAHASPTPPDPATLAALAHRYEAVDAPRVASLLATHGELVGVLLAAAEPLTAAFPPGSVLRLERSYFDDEELLFARVYRHGLEVEEAEARLGQFHETWWYAQSPDLARHLEFSVGWGD